MKLVIIEWEDSHQGTGWEVIEGAEFIDKSLTVRSVGWLAMDGKNAKILIPHLSNECDNVKRQGSGIMTIPTRAIITLTEVGEECFQKT